MSSSLLDNDDDINNDNSCWWSSWNASHLKACRARKSLSATPQQVLEYSTKQAEKSNHDIRSLIYWSLPEHQQVTLWKYSSNKTAKSDGETKGLTAMIEAVLPSNNIQSAKHHYDETPTTPVKTMTDTDVCTPPSTPNGGVLQYVTSAFSPIVGFLTPSRRPPPTMMEEQDDALRDWESPCHAQEEEYDAACEEEPQQQQQSNYSLAGSELIPWDASVLNTELAMECLAILDEALVALADSEASAGTFPPIVTRWRADGTASSHKCWLDWVRSAAGSATNNNSSDSILAHLSELEANFLLECLAHKGSLMIIPPQEGTSKQELVALTPQQQQLANGNSTINSEAKLYPQVLATWWQLSTAQASWEAQRQEWSKQADIWAERALQERKKSTGSQKKAGLGSFQRHKLFQKRLEESEGVLLNLEQAIHVLEESWLRRQVVQALETSTQTLQQLRTQQDASVYKVDDLMEDYQEELDHANTMQQSLSQSSQQQAVYDEDDLLAELAGLTLQEKKKEDEQVPSKTLLTVVNATAGKTTTEPSGSSKENTPAAATDAKSTDTGNMKKTKLPLAE